MDQQSISVALATAMHHSSGKVHTVDGAPRGKTSATRAGEKRHEENYNAPRRQKPPPHQAFFQLCDEEDPLWGARPASLTEPLGPQERVQQRAVEQIDDFAPMVQILEVPVLPVVLGWVQDGILQRIVEQAFTDDKEQEIAGPRISSPDRIPPRAFCFCVAGCGTAMEVSVVSPMDCALNVLVSLVEMPNIVFHSKFQQHFVEQTFDIPVRGSVGHGPTALRGAVSSVGLQGCPSKRGSTALREAHLHEDFQGLVPGQNSSASCVGPQGTVFTSFWWSFSSRFCPSTEFSSSWLS